MPSLHVGWALWCAAAVVVTARSRWRHLAWLYPLATTADVISTGNHFVLDCVAGALLVTVMLWLTGPSRSQSRSEPRSLMAWTGRHDENLETRDRDGAEHR